MTGLLLALILSQNPEQMLKAATPVMLTEVAPATQPLLHTVQDRKLRIAVKTVLVANIAAHTLDLASTQYMLGTGMVFEANPAMRWAADSPFRMGLVKSAVGVGSSLLLARVAQRKPKLALVIGSIMTGITTAVVVHNLNVYQDLKRQGKIR